MNGPSRLELLALVWGVALTLASYHPVRFDALVYDELAYAQQGVDIHRLGLFDPGAARSHRTYLYPLILSSVCQLASDPRSAVLGLHLVLYFSAALFFRAWMISRGFDRRLVRPVFISVCLNPFALVMMSYALTETVSLIFIIGFICFVCGTWDDTSPRNVIGFALAGACLGAAIQTRPANVSLCPVAILYLLACLYRARTSSEQWRTVLRGAVLWIAAGLVCVPQVYSNWKNFDRVTPLVAIDLGGKQVGWGLSHLKYATSIAPAPIPPDMRYINPFYKPQDGSTLRYYWRHPGELLVLSGIHCFGMIDQDLPRVYNKTFHPWYRWPSTLVSLLMFLLGMAGLLRCSLVRWLRGREELSTWSKEVMFCWVCLATVVASFALHCFTAVEARFGLPVIALSLMFMTQGIAAWRTLSLRGRISSAAAAALFLCLGCLLSHWMQMQCQQLAANPPPPPPARSPASSAAESPATAPHPRATVPTPDPAPPP